MQRDAKRRWKSKQETSQQRAMSPSQCSLLSLSLFSRLSNLHHTHTLSRSSLLSQIVSAWCLFVSCISPLSSLSRFTSQAIFFSAVSELPRLSRSFSLSLLFLPFLPFSLMRFRHSHTHTYSSFPYISYFPSMPVVLGGRGGGDSLHANLSLSLSLSLGNGLGRTAGGS